ncbi:MAG: NADP-dependent isocitrate dehydrogenase [Desulfovibrionaceae bacterium]
MVTQKVYFIEGDGIGPEIWKAGRPVIEAAVAKCYGDERTLEWEEVLAGEKAYKATGQYLPEASMDTLRKAKVAMKGPLGTPVGKGFRSLNVTMRQAFDLYACIRPIRYYQGIQSPVKHPEKVNMVVFRENTEDVYAGIEWAAGTPEARRLLSFLRDELNANVDLESGVGIKPVTERGCKRLVEAAVRFALETERRSVTLVHKGNIMKYTEGAFMNWGYEVARDLFKEQTMTESEVEAGDKPLIIKDRIADAMFQAVLLWPEEFDVIATTNLNGDYLSDALAAQVGGLGLAPGMNKGTTLTIYEPTHGTAPTLVGLDKGNPGSLILSGALMLEELGWTEAAQTIHAAVEAAIAAKTVTADLARQMDGATSVGCQKFAEILLERL